MGMEEFYEPKTWLKLAILGIPLLIFILAFAPTLKWKIVLSIGGLLGMFIALSGSSLRRRN